MGMHFFNFNLAHKQYTSTTSTPTGLPKQRQLVQGPSAAKEVGTPTSPWRVMTKREGERGGVLLVDQAWTPHWWLISTGECGVRADDR